MTLPALSPRQATVYRLLRDHRNDTGDTPHLTDLAEDIGITYVTLKQHLEALDRKGYITFESRGRGRAPVIRLAEPEPTGFVWPTVWHPLTETLPVTLAEGEVLAFAVNGVTPTAVVLDRLDWSNERAFWSKQVTAAYAWAVLRLPPSPEEVSDA